MRFDKIDIIKRSTNLYRVKIDTSHSIITLPQIVVQDVSLYSTIGNPFLSDFSFNPDYFHDFPLVSVTEIYGKIDFKISVDPYCSFIQIADKNAGGVENRRHACVLWTGRDRNPKSTDSS